MKIIAGVDEVGRGSLIGPVYAAAVILNNSVNEKILKDTLNSLGVDHLGLDYIDREILNVIIYHVNIMIIFNKLFCKM